jgi:hypothetical protein
MFFVAKSSLSKGLLHANGQRHLDAETVSVFIIGAGAVYVNRGDMTLTRPFRASR